MALHMPKPRATAPTKKATGLDGMKVHVAGAAAAGVAKAQTSSGGLAGLTSKVSVAQLRTEAGDAGLRQAAIDAGRTPPSDRTLRRWAQQDRIPDARTAELAHRRAAIERLGGVQAVAKMIGRSPSAVSKYQTGVTQQLRNDANSKLKKAKATDTMKKAGVIKPDGSTKIATIQITGRVHVRNGNEEGYDFRTRTMDFANSDTPFSEAESQALAMALANDDQARVVAILEQHATMSYPESSGFDQYGDQFGFHFEAIDDFTVTWA